MCSMAARHARSMARLPRARRTLPTPPAMHGHEHPLLPLPSAASVITTAVRGKQSKRRSQSSQKWLERQHKDPYVVKAQQEGLPSRASFKLEEINEIHFTALQAKLRKKRKANNTNLSRRRRLIEPDMLILDLGAAPGGWSLYASTQLQSALGGAVVAVDLLPLDETLQSNNSDVSSRIESNLGDNFEFIQGDFTSNQTRMQIVEAFSRVSNTSGQETDDTINYGRRPNLVLSDMAPNFTGDAQTDGLRTLNLCEKALAFAAGSNCFDTSFPSQQNKGMLTVGGAFLCKYFSCGKDNESDLMEATKRAFQSAHVIKPKSSRKDSSEMYLLALGYRKHITFKDD